MKPPEYKVPLAGSDRGALPGFRPLRRENPLSVVDTCVVLRPQSGLQIDASVADLASRLPQQRHYLTREQFAAANGADANAVHTLLQFAARHGLRTVKIDEAARAVYMRGNVAALSRAFNVELVVYHRKRCRSERRYRGRTGPIYLPAELEGIVQAVMGLDNRPQARAHFRYQHQFGGAWPHAGAVAYSPDRLARHYNFPDGLTGEGQCIGIVALGGGYSVRELRAYFEASNLPVLPIVSISVHRMQNRPSLEMSQWLSQVTSSIQLARAIAPGSRLVVYLAPRTTNGLFEAVTRAIHDGINKPSIVAINWGRAEAAWTSQSLRAFDEAFQAAALMGVTVCCTAGDRGSSDGNPGRLAHASFPASSPHVLACGGTSLSPAGYEVVWNDGPGGGAGGGGVSEFFGLPQWQQNGHIPRSVNPNGHQGRGVPDVAANAGPRRGYGVYVHRRYTAIGGTSAGCLLWSGLIARLNQKLGASVGFINPLIYERASQAGFSDVTDGDNDLAGWVGAYVAGPGWDACTGWGTPNGVGLLNTLL